MMIFNLLVFLQMIFIISGTSLDNCDKNIPPRILVSSSTGLQYIKSVNSDGTFNVTYDCSFGGRDEGDINLGDDNHPTKMKFFVIKNCLNITVHFSTYSHDVFHFEVLKKLKVRNVHTLIFNSDNYGEYKFKSNDINIDVADVKFLKIGEEVFKNVAFSSNTTITLKIQGIDYATFLMNSIGSGISKIYIEEVKQGIFKRNSINLNNPEAVLVIKNSNFESVESGGLIFEGSQVEIFNNSFETLQAQSFVVNAYTSFIFEKNSVKNIGSSFYISSPNVQIVSNFFDKINGPWFPSIIITSHDSLGVLNISSNTMNSLPAGFFSMNSLSLPDLILFKNNYFNCTCKYWNVINHSESLGDKLVQEMLLYKNDENFCLNLGNCPLPQVFSRMSELCQGKFICNQEKKTDPTLETNLTNILSTLNIISNKLDNLITENNFTTSKKNIISTTAQPVTTNFN